MASFSSLVRDPLRHVSRNRTSCSLPRSRLPWTSRKSEATSSGTEESRYSAHPDDLGVSDPPSVALAPASE